MDFSFFISKHISKPESNTFTATIHKIAVASIALGLAIMIVSILILGGFKRNVTEKIYSFGGHLQVTKFTVSSSFEESPVSLNSVLYQHPDSFPHVTHVQSFSYKAGLLRTDEDVQGVILKGVGEDFDEKGFEKNLVKGDFLTHKRPNGSTDILISVKLANLLQLDVGDDVIMYFVQVPQRFRKLTIKGIYNTGLEDFDDKIILGDIALTQRLNNWDSTQVGGFEVFIDDLNALDQSEDYIYRNIENDLYVESSADLNLQTFEWLNLLAKNVNIFLGLLIFVACFNMITILFIMIMERTQMIGMLKALGATNRQIRKIFIYNGMQLILKGLLIGNLIGIGFGILQDQFQLISLDPENYYMDFVPIEWNNWLILALNLMTFLLVTATLLIPTAVITKVRPIKAIRFD
ncbi:ABC transporter permease [Xanthovirga aplysinae]|uniref:ABC transporter permease n=1 Tax=Xanthovirga aplysinae TaxID=2529853 RepID=UPI0012BBF17F|nr:FtsX-like permease family protein [Xanthovirga aplysinae]MTI32035.1 ABC transporter permease [Xanthovirga aplysinae]